MKIIGVSSPKYSKIDNSAIDVIAEFDYGRILPYTSRASDNEPHGIQLWEELVSGKHGGIQPYQS